MTDFFGDDQGFETDNLPTRQTAPVEIKTANSNIGAIRVAVPRDLAHVMKDINIQAQQFGQGWLYRLPFNKKQRDGSTRIEFVEGPTIGCALDVARAYGNCSVDCSDIQETADAWLFNAVFLDIETGFRHTRSFRQRKNQNIGGMGGDKGRAEDIIFQIGASKAIRNVIRNSLRGLIDSALRFGAQRLTEKVDRDRPGVIKKITDRLAELDIPVKRIQAHHQKVLADLESFELAAIIKTFQAVTEGLISADEFYPEAGKETPKVSSAPTAATSPQGNIINAEQTGLTVEKNDLSNQDRMVDKPKRKRITVVFDGTEYTKTNYLRDISQMIRQSESMSNLGLIDQFHKDAMNGLDENDALAINHVVLPLIRKNLERLQGPQEEEEEGEEGEEGEHDYDEAIDENEDDGQGYA